MDLEIPKQIRVHMHMHMRIHILSAEQKTPWELLFMFFFSEPNLSDNPKNHEAKAPKKRCPLWSRLGP